MNYRIRMKNITFIILLTALLAASLAGCSKKESFSDIPEIGFVSYFNVFDTGQYAKEGILTISFQDGNGDIGLTDRDVNPPYDSAGPYYYNLVITYYERQMGAYKQIDLGIPFSARIPLLNPLDPGRAIKGTITDTLTMNPHPVYDTIKFDVFIYDRALHKSNVVTTPDIILRRQ
jgi:hypothetical protein